MTIPEVNLYIDIDKDKSWLAKVWMADELFYYLYPFKFIDYFQTKLNKYQFQVLVEIIQRYSFLDIQKEFHFEQFISSYSKTLNGKSKIQIKEYFIQYLQDLANQKQIRAEVLLLPSNQTHDISQLT